MTREDLDFIGSMNMCDEISNEAYKKIVCHCEEQCEDCISREAVDTLVDELARAISDERCFISRGRDTATIMQDILDLPSVTPQPKIGRWIDEPYYKISEYGEEDTYYKRKCSKCFEKYDVVFNYCPNCGAKMEGE